MRSAAFALLCAFPMVASVTAQPETKPAAPAKPATPSQPEAPKKDAPKEAPKETPKEEAKPADPYVLGYTVKDIDGKDQKLDQYKGKVIMIVNVASKCGLTDSQYAGLQKIYDLKKDKGFVILAFPANDFAGQEPGKDSDIKAFCQTEKNITFPIFSKISVRGAEQHPLFKQLASQAKPLGAEPSWNFTKYIINREGKVVERFEPRIAPDDSNLLKRLDELLAEGGKVAKPGEASKPADAPKPDAKPQDKPADTK